MNLYENIVNYCENNKNVSHTIKINIYLLIVYGSFIIINTKRLFIDLHALKIVNCWN